MFSFFCIETAMSSNDEIDEFEIIAQKFKQKLNQLNEQTEGYQEFIELTDEIIKISASNSTRSMKMIEKAEKQSLKTVNMLSRMERLNRVNKRRTISVIIYSLIVLTMSFLFMFGEIKYDYSRKQIDESISNLISNGADLDTINYELKNSQLEQKSFLIGDEFYGDNVNLSDVLISIKRNYYKDRQPRDTFSTKLDAIITEHNEVDPFSKLQSYQKDLFSNVRYKADVSYVNINADINKIVQELDNKNTLVDEYLDKSNLSFWVSMLGLFIAVITALAQIVVAYRKNNFVSDDKFEELKDDAKTTSNSIRKAKTSITENAF
jgi:hypothetical protein